MAWNGDVRLAGGDDDDDGECCSDDGCDAADDAGVDGFNDKGKGSGMVVLFKLRSAIFEDGGIGARGIGRISLGVGDDVLVLFRSNWLLAGPNVRLSNDAAPLTGLTGNITGPTLVG